MTGCCRSASAFQWEDGSTSPSVIPSGQGFTGEGWSHWGLSITGNISEPSGDDLCAATGDLKSGKSLIYSYFNGTTVANKNSSTRYNISYTSQDLMGWIDVPCNITNAYICELTSEGRRAWRDC